MSEKPQYILFGAGTIGRLVARQLIEKGTPPVAFADNDMGKWAYEVEGIKVYLPADCRKIFPDAQWVATVHRTPARPEILKHIEEMGVKSISLYDFIPARCDHPPGQAADTVDDLLADSLSRDFFYDQLTFRRDPGLVTQIPHLDIANVYFEDFYTHLPDEHFVDCGAADGDTIIEFHKRWPSYRHITAFEPDPDNYNRLIGLFPTQNDKFTMNQVAVSDREGFLLFAATGDQTSHLDKSGTISAYASRLDNINFTSPPTLIKMDIEGSELEGLWGAREIIKKHSPVLAICAYHKGSDLWEIPLLIHAINPRYKLYFRRYLEATWELVYYAVPPDRLVK